VAADYTRNIVFSVNDKAIRRATDRITKSLTNIERTLKRIEGKGFNNLAKSAEKASKSIITSTDSIRALEQRTKNLGKVGKDLVNTYGKSFQRINQIGLNPLNSILKDTVDSFKTITFAAKRSGQDLRTIFELFNAGKIGIMSFATAIGTAISNTRNFGSVFINTAGSIKTNLTTLGTLLDANIKKTGTFINVLGLSQGLFSQPKNIFQNTEAAFAQNTALARQNSMRGNVLRNTLRSQAGRTGSNFADFSQDANQVTRVMNSRGRPSGFIGPDRPGIQDPTAKAIRRNQAKRDRLLQNELRIRKNILKVEQQGLVIAKTELSVGAGGQGFIGPRLQRGTRLRQQFQEGGAFFNSRGRAGRIASAAQSGLIGGGFPLLFGQSPGAAGAGGLGGALGGALSPGFGFAGSIVATAAAQKIQEAKEFQKQIDKLNKSIRLTGGDSEFSVAGIKRLGQELGITKDEALQAARSFEAFGAAARINLIKVFGDEATFNSLKNLRKTVDVLNNIDLIEKKIGKKRADQAVNVALAAGGLEAQKFVLEEMFKLQMKEAEKGKLTGMNKFRATLSSMGQTLLGGGGKKNVFIGGLQQNMIDKTASAQAASMRKFNEEQRRLEARDIVRQISEPKDELKELMDPLKQLISLSRSVGDSFAESFRGIVSGSMTAQQALRNLFQRTADHFLDMAAQMIAKQITMSILGIGLRFFSGGFAPSRGANTGGTDLFGRDFDDEMFGMPLADGGIAKAGRTHLVGERGPELFTPGVTGTVTPNHALGGSTNVVVNVDAFGSSVEGDEENGRELGRMISVAIQSELIKQKRPGGLLT